MFRIPAAFAVALVFGALSLAAVGAPTTAAVKRHPGPAAAQKAPAPAPAPDGPMTMGSPKAPVTVVEYASVGCPHCADWAVKVLPEFKKRFIDTGKAKLEFHEMITGDPELAVAGFLVARCAPAARYFDVVDEIFDRQVEIARGGGDALFGVAQKAGLTRPQFDACLTNDKALTALEQRTTADAKAHNVESTPTFIVGGQKLVGDVDLETLATAIGRAQKRG